MIPQPLKWVGAVLALVILVIVVAPVALDSMLGTVSFSDEGGLISGDVDDPLEEDPDGAPGDGTGPDDGEPDDGENGDDGNGDEDNGDEENGDENGGENGDEENGEADDESDETPETYEVESGDTLFSIAETVYGDGHRWQEIAEENNIDDRTGIRVGEELVIP